jgi:hypothetical protein
LAPKFGREGVLVFTYRYDAALPAMVGIYSGREPMRLAWEAEAEPAARLAQRAKEKNVRGLYLHVIDPEVPQADGPLRHDIAQRAAAQVAPFDYAMVTASKLTRGIVTVVLWFQKQDYHFTSVHGDVESALVALEKRRGMPLPVVRAMYSAARDEVRRAAPEQRASA